jgi:hypothetical protein
MERQTRALAALVPMRVEICRGVGPLASPMRFGGRAGQLEQREEVASPLDTGTVKVPLTQMTG